MFLHTDTQLADWSEGWEARFDAAFDGAADPVVLESLWLERADWMDRHPCRRIIGTWTPICAPKVRAPANPTQVERWRPLVARHFPASAVNTAVCLIHYESRGRADAYNRSSGASGLLQVLSSWAPKFGVSKSDLFDPDTNLRISAALYADGGWKHWSPWKRGLCRGL